MTAVPKVTLPIEVERLDRIIPLSKAAELRGVSIDTLKRREPEKIIRLSPRRLGMRLKDALLLQPNGAA